MSIDSGHNLEHPMTIAELFKLCELPVKCGSALKCEGQMVWVQGVIDPDNVFDHKTYPQLVYEKFWLRPQVGGNAVVEVFVQVEHSQTIFANICQARASYPGIKTIVHGRVQGFDMPSMDTCHRGVSLMVGNVGAVHFL